MSAITKSLLLANVTWPLSYSNRWIVLYSSPRVVRECLGGGGYGDAGSGWVGGGHPIFIKQTWKCCLRTRIRARVLPDFLKWVQKTNSIHILAIPILTKRLGILPGGPELL